MKRLLQCGCIVFILVAIFTNCSKDKKTLLESTWRVQDARWHADSAWIKDWGIVTLSFIGKDKYVFQSYSYCAIAKVIIEKNNKICFIDPMTRPYFPSFANSCMSLLTNYTVNHYEIDGRKLVLTGKNGETIILEK